jgi:hypothetical protein
MAWIRPERVRHALKNLSEWRKSAKDQGATHLVPLLALLEKGAGGGQEVQFNETPHEFEFWDRYFRLDDMPEKPYFNPITLRRAEKGFPHSNAATIRKNTFALKWHAAERRQSGDLEYWKLSPSFADIFRAKVLMKGGVVSRVPVVDLAIVLFRNDEIESPTAAGLEALFKARFPTSDEAYRTIFEFRDEEPANIFSDQSPGSETVAAIKAALIEDVSAPSQQTPASEVPKTLDIDDPILLQVEELLKVGTSGIILTGPPGTGKTYYAQRIARHLVKDPEADIFRVQFHPSFGYEDFVEGYRPDETKSSGFSIVPKVFMRACARAAHDNDHYVVFIVDEINRGDPARIFGELLTYLERSYRETSFTLPFSGDLFSIPKKMLLLGTMNPFDRSTNHIDAAFVRRFDHIEIAPSRDALEAMLELKGFSVRHVEIIGDWFDEVQKLVRVGLGHALFADVADIDSLKVIWRYRIKPAADALMEQEPQMRENLVKSFEAMIRRLEGVTAAD